MKPRLQGEWSEGAEAREERFKKRHWSDDGGDEELKTERKEADGKEWFSAARAFYSRSLVWLLWWSVGWQGDDDVT